MKGYWFILGTDITDEEAQQKYGKLSRNEFASLQTLNLLMKVKRFLINSLLVRMRFALGYERLILVQPRRLQLTTGFG